MKRKTGRLGRPRIDLAFIVRKTRYKIQLIYLNTI